MTTTNRRILTSAWIVTVLFFAPLASRAIDITGNYTGTWDSDVEEDTDGELDVSFTQSGNDVTGSFTITNEPCLGRATLTATLSGERLRGTFTSVDTDERGSFDLIVETADGAIRDIVGSYAITAGCFDGDHGAIVLFPSAVTPTDTPTPTPSNGPTTVVTPSLPVCTGDCNDDGELTVDELVKGVNMALGTTALEQCPKFDRNGDGAVSIDEIVKAVDAALRGCVKDQPTPNGPTMTPTPTGTFTPTGTHTPAAASVARRSVGLIVSSTQAFLTIAEIVPVLLAPTSGGGAGGADGGGPRVAAVPIPCPNGGAIAVSCVQVPPRVGVPNYTINASNCTVATSTGTQVLNGSMTATDNTSGHRCITDRPSNVTVTIPSFTATSTTGAGSTVATLSGVTGSIVLSGSDATCTYDSADLRLTGTAKSEVKNTSGDIVTQSHATFQNTQVVVAVDTFGSQCTPVVYSTTVDGSATITSSGTSLAATYAAFKLQTDDSSGMSSVAISGDVTAACFGTPIRLDTTGPIILPSGAACPTGGRVLVDSASEDVVRFLTVGLEIDAAVDEMFTSCLDPRLYICPIL